MSLVPSSDADTERLARKAAKKARKSAARDAESATQESTVEPAQSTSQAVAQEEHVDASGTVDEAESKRLKKERKAAKRRAEEAQVEGALLKEPNVPATPSGAGKKRAREGREVEANGGESQAASTSAPATSILATPSTEDAELERRRAKKAKKELKKRSEGVEAEAFVAEDNASGVLEPKKLKKDRKTSMGGDVAPIATTSSLANFDVDMDHDSERNSPAASTSKRTRVADVDVAVDMNNFFGHQSAASLTAIVIATQPTSEAEAEKKRAKKARRESKKLAQEVEVEGSSLEEAASASASKADKKGKKRASVANEPPPSPAPVASTSALSAIGNLVRQDALRSSFQDASTVRASSPEPTLSEPDISRKREGKQRRRESEPPPSLASKGSRAAKVVPSVTATPAAASAKIATPTAASANKLKQRAIRDELENMTDDEAFLKALATSTLYSAVRDKGKGKEKAGVSKVRKPLADKKSSEKPKGKGKEKAEEYLLGGDGSIVADTLATKWMTPKDLAEFAKEHSKSLPRETLLLQPVWYSLFFARATDITLRTGPYSPAEDASLNAAITSFQSSHQFSSDLISALIMSSRTRPSSIPVSDVVITRSLLTEMWTHIALSAPLRPISSVYSHVRRVRDPLASQGQWSAAEEAALKKAVKACGSDMDWVEVSAKVGRSSGDCRDHWRNEMNGGQKAKKGPWDEAEKTALVEAVKKFGENWGAVSKKMGGRTPYQCREKWADGLTTWRTKLDGGDQLGGKDGAANRNVFPKKYRSNLVIALSTLSIRRVRITNLGERPGSIYNIDWPTVRDSDPALANRSDRRLKRAFEALLETAKAESGKTTFEEQLVWLENRYPLPGKHYTAKTAAKILRKRKRDAAKGEDSDAESDDGTEQVFKSAEAIDSDQDESEIQEDELDSDSKGGVESD
ncbi:hypothetical protein P7C70_g5710, partial [Phenoliferia sp. Uapishka_3]